MSSGNDIIKSIIKKIVFHQNIKGIKNKLQIKSKFSINHASTETIKRIIDDLDIEKPSSGESPTYCFKERHLVLDTVTVSVNKASKTEYFPVSLKCANVRPIH